MIQDSVPQSEDLRPETYRKLSVLCKYTIYEELEFLREPENHHSECVV